MIVRYSTLFIFGLVISLFVFVNSAFAETTVESTSFEKTIILEFTNNDSVQIKTVRIWLGAEAGTFKSFKTEKGWTGMKTPQGVLVFTSEKQLGPGESVKFGVKTENEASGINWKTLDINGNEVTIGKITLGQSSQPSEITTSPSDNSKPITANLDNAVFRIIPDKPKNGNSIRIVGYGFPPNEQLDFAIDGEKIEDFLTDGTGNLLGRSKIPLKAADRVEFSLSDDHGNKKVISLRIEHREDQLVSPKQKHLTVEKFTENAEPGQIISVSGTGEPNSTVTITAQDQDGNKIYEAVVTVNNQGRWSYEMTIPPNTPLGTRNIKFSDGIDTIEKTLSISVSKIINIKSSTIKYNVGDKMVFTGTATPNKPIEIIINDPIGKEIFSDILSVGDNGIVNFEYQTQTTYMKGTYVVTFTQEEESEIIRIGLGEIPTEQIIAKLNKLNYLSSEKAKLALQGPSKTTVSLLIIDPSDRVKLSDNITLGSDGKAEYEINLSDYKSGVYSVVIKYQKFQTTVVFSVGLQTSSGPIQVQTTKQTYQLGDSILILGSTNPNVLLKVEMLDPNGNVIKRKEIFSDKEGKFKDGTFRMPNNAKEGKWLIRVSSGPNYAEAKLIVAGTVQQSFVVTTNKSSYNNGETVMIGGTGGGQKQTTVVRILDSADTKIQELTVMSTDAGSFQIIWIIPPDLNAGIYKIRATIGADTAETTITIK